MLIFEVVLDSLCLLRSQINSHVISKGTCELLCGKTLILVLIVLVEELTYVHIEFLDLCHQGLDDIFNTHYNCRCQVRYITTEPFSEVFLSNEIGECVHANKVPEQLIYLLIRGALNVFNNEFAEISL